MPLRAALALILLLSACLPSADDPTPEAVAQAAGPVPGLVVQVGGGDRLPALLATGTAIGLAVVADEAVAAGLRAAWAGQGLAGQAAAVALAGARIPLIDDAARVVVADLDATPGVAASEVLRVLQPNGAGWMCQGGVWKRLAKSRPVEVDDWAQYHYNAAASEVSRDQRAGPARGIQWTSGPQATSASGLRIIEGLCLAIETCEGGVSDQRIPALVARDAYTGLLRWRREAVVPGSRFAWAAGHGKVFFYPAPDATGRYARHLRMLDLATGADAGWVDQGVTVPVPEPFPAHGQKDRDEVLKRLKTLTADACIRLTEDARLVQVMAGQVAVVDIASGARLWLRQFEDLTPMHPVVLGDALYLALGTSADSCSYTHWPAVNLRALVCVGLADGKERWRTPWDPAQGELVLYNLAGASGHLAGAGRFANVGNRGRHGQLVVEAASGRIVHGGPTALTTNRRGEPDEIGGGHSSARSFIIGDRAWATTIVSLNGSVPLSAPATKDGIDQRYAGLLRPVGCTTFRATPNWIFGSLTTYAISGESRVFQTDALRTHCDVGAFPALGLSFIMSNGCFCTPYLPGSATFHPRPFAGPEDAGRLAAGPAKPAPVVADPGGWPAFLRDQRRSAWCPDEVPADLAEVWRIRPEPALPADPLLARAWQDSWYLQGPLTQPVLAEGVAVVARGHHHQVLACDPATGAERWRATLDGRIAGAPTIHQGLVLVGTRAGTVYALNRDDGRIVWNFRAAPRSERIVVDGQLESPWPCFGSVVADATGVLVVAGRHSDADGGLWWWRLDAATGKPLGQGRFGGDELKSTTPGSGRTKGETSDPWVPNVCNNIPVVTPDRFLLPGLSVARNAAGDLVMPGPVPRLKRGESAEHKGWEDRFRAGVLVPGNQGLLHRPAYIGGYKLASYSYSSARFYAWSGTGDFAMVGGSVGFTHRGGQEGNTLRACRRLPDLQQKEVVDGKDPAKKRTIIAGAEVLWEQNDMSSWRGDGLRALAVAGKAIVIGFAVTNKDHYKLRTEMPFRLRVLAFADGTQIGKDQPLPAPPVSGGIAIANGRILVACEDGSLVCFAAPRK